MITLLCLYKNSVHLNSPSLSFLALKMKAAMDLTAA